MYRKPHDHLFFLALLSFALTACYWAGAKYGFADAPGNDQQNCISCPCKNVLAFQTEGDPSNVAYGAKQIISNNPPTYGNAVGWGKTGINAEPSCSNQTGDTMDLNEDYELFKYVDAQPACENGQPLLEMSASDNGAPKSSQQIVVCKPSL